MASLRSFTIRQVEGAGVPLRNRMASEKSRAAVVFPPARLVVPGFPSKHGEKTLFRAFFEEMPFVHNVAGFQPVRRNALIEELRGFAESHLYGSWTMLHYNTGRRTIAPLRDLLLGMISTGAGVCRGKVVPAEWHRTALAEALVGKNSQKMVRKTTVAEILRAMRPFLHDPTILDRRREEPRVGEDRAPGAQTIWLPPGVKLPRRGRRGSGIARGERRKAK